MLMMTRMARMPSLSTDESRPAVLQVCPRAGFGRRKIAAQSRSPKRLARAGSRFVASPPAAARRVDHRSGGIFI